VAPDEVGLSEERLERLEKHFEAYVSSKRLSGLTTLVARKGKVAHFKTYGQMNIEQGTSMQDDAIFRIYSMTKPITGVGLMMLYEEGKFRLTDPLHKYLPEYKDAQVFKSVDDDGNIVTEPAKRQITVLDIMRHTAGLTYGVFGNTPVDQAYVKAGLFDTTKTLEEVSKTLGSLPLLYQPGENWVYSLAVDIQGRLIEVLSGMPLDQYFEEKIFKPLGMSDTGFYVPADKEDRFVEMYSFNNQGQLIPYVGDFRPDHSKKPTLLSGGGGLVSTTADYFRFSQMLLNGGKLGEVRLLSPKTIELMTTDHLDGAVGFAPKQGFGLDFMVVKDITSLGTAGSIGEFNWGGLANTLFWVDPKEEIVAILMTNIVAPPGSVTLREEMRQMVYQAIAE
jgi:CubicO group peptidase (beta-lactamase class C family)